MITKWLLTDLLFFNSSLSSYILRTWPHILTSERIASSLIVLVLLPVGPPTAWKDSTMCFFVTPLNLLSCNYLCSSWANSRLISFMTWKIRWDLFDLANFWVAITFSISCGSFIISMLVTKVSLVKITGRVENHITIIKMTGPMWEPKSRAKSKV